MKTMHWLTTVSAAVVLSGAFAAQAVAAETHGNTPAAGDPKAGEAKASTICMACHGPQGNSIVPTWPKVAGQHPDYIYKQLMDFKAGNRQNAQMSPMAAPLTEQEMRDLAAYYATQTQTGGAADPELATLGEQIYRAGNPATGVPACSGCHGPAGMGTNLAKFPRISGQHADYTKQTLTYFRAGERANDPNAMMRGVAAKMTDKEIAAVSQYLQGLSQ
jgi:cytochrome c553